MIPLLIAAAALVGVASIAGCGGSKKEPRNAEDAEKEVSSDSKPSQAYNDECGEIEEYGQLYAELIGAVGIPGCGGSKKEPRNTEDAKEKVSPDSKPTHAYNDECKDLEEYGQLYVDTCSYFADQCYTQNALKEKGTDEIQVDAWDRAVYRGYSYDECLEKSKYYTKRHGPLPYNLLPKRFRWPLGTYLLLQAEAEIAGIDPRNHSEKWKPIAEHMLLDRGILKQGEEIENLINGRIAGARASKSGKKELVIVMLDSHGDKNVQSQIVNDVDELHKRGIHLIGVEGRSVFPHAVCDPAINDKAAIEPACKNAPASDEVECDPTVNDDAKIMLACKIGASASIQGVETAEPYLAQSLASNRLRTKQDLSSDEKKCDWFKTQAAYSSIAIIRSSYMFNNLLGDMTIGTEKTTEAVLIIGAGHLSDLQAMFDAEDLSYIAVAVPAFDTEIVKYIDEEGKHHNLITIGGSIENINSMCD